MSDTIYDAIIIGAGPAGLTSALYLLRDGKSVMVLEGNGIGGQIAQSPRLENYPSILSISGTDFADALFNQVTELGAEIDFAEVLEIIQGEGEFAVKSEYEVYHGKSVIIASGCKHRHLGLAREEELVGHGVSYCATCDGAFYQGKNVALLGGNDRVLEDALYLAGIASNVHLFVPSDPNFSFSLLQECSSLSNFHLHSHADILKISGDAKVDSILVKEGMDTHSLPIDGVFPMKEGVSASGFLNGLSPEKEKQFLVVNEDMMTSIPGIFACGDVVKKKLRQIVNAAGEAAVAASMAIRYVRSH